MFPKFSQNTRNEKMFYGLYIPYTDSESPFYLIMVVKPKAALILDVSFPLYWS